MDIVLNAEKKLGGCYEDIITQIKRKSLLNQELVYMASELYF